MPQQNKICETYVLPEILRAEHDAKTQQNYKIRAFSHLSCKKEVAGRQANVAPSGVIYKDCLCEVLLLSD